MFKRLIFPHWMILALLWKINLPLMYEFISELSILFYWSMWLSICLYYIILITAAFLVSFETKKDECSNFIVLFQDHFGYLRPHTKLDQLFHFQKKMWNFDGDCTECINHFSDYCHLDNIVFWSMNMGVFKNFFQ